MILAMIVIAQTIITNDDTTRGPSLDRPGPPSALAARPFRRGAEPPFDFGFYVVLEIIVDLFIV